MFGAKLQSGNADRGPPWPGWPAFPGRTSTALTSSTALSPSVVGARLISGHRDRERQDAAPPRPAPLWKRARPSATSGAARSRPARCRRPGQQVAALGRRRPALPGLLDLGRPSARRRAGRPRGRRRSGCARSRSCPAGTARTRRTGRARARRARQQTHGHRAGLDRLERAVAAEPEPLAPSGPNRIGSPCSSRISRVPRSAP
jgi:hypothetical protein